MLAALILTVGLPLAAVLILALLDHSQPTAPSVRPPRDRRQAATFKGRP